MFSISSTIKRADLLLLCCLGGVAPALESSFEGTVWATPYLRESEVHAGIRADPRPSAANFSTHYFKKYFFRLTQKDQTSPRPFVNS